VRETTDVYGTEHQGTSLFCNNCTDIIFAYVLFSTSMCTFHGQSFALFYDGICPSFNKLFPYLFMFHSLRTVPLLLRIMWDIVDWWYEWHLASVSTQSYITGGHSTFNHWMARV